MDSKVVNRNWNCVFNAPYAGRDLNITMFQEKERGFVVTHNANIKPVSYFTGRETELLELRQKIECERKSVLVSGMGGIGKTHICRKLFEEYLTKHVECKNGFFEYIGYIEYDGNMDNSLKNCLKFKQQDDLEQNQEAAWRELEYLASNGRLLLFIDNVNNSISVDPSLQRLKSIPGTVVLTSRQASFGDEFEPYQISFLSMEQCKTIYEKIKFKGTGRKIQPEEVQELKYIIESLVGRHTITVELLAHLACTKHWTVKRLREELEKKGFCLEFHRSGELVNIQESYEVLYDLSGLTTAEQNILEAFSVFPYIPLAVQICNEWLLIDAGASEDDDILAELFQKGWLQFYVEQESYALHPVFAQFIYEKFKPQLKNHLKLIENCQRRLMIPKSGSVLECQIYIPFAETMIEKLSSRKNLEKIIFISAIAFLLYHTAEYKKAEELYKKILQICERSLGEEHPDTVASYNCLAVVYEEQGKYKKAEELYKKSLRINERLLGEEHPDTAGSYNNLAGVYHRQGRYKKAKELYEKSLRIREELLGKEHLSTAASYNNLANVYKNQGEYKKAEMLYEKSLQIREKSLGKEHPDTAMNYGYLAGVYKELGEYKKAEILYEKSLRIREKLLGEDHPDTAASYNNLASVYEYQGEYKKAEELYEISCRINEKLLGEEHPSTATSYNNLAGVYERQGEYKKAEELYEISCRIDEKLLGEEHPSTATSYNNLASVYERQGEYKKAEELYKKSLCIREKLLGEESPVTAASYNNLASVYEDQGEYKKAEELYKKSLCISEKLLGEESPVTATSYNNLANVYENQGEYKKAEELHKKSLCIRKRLLGEEHLNTAISYNNLAKLYSHQKKYEFALSYFIKAYKIFINKLGFEHPDTIIIFENLVITYTRWNPKGDFEQWLIDMLKGV